MRMEFLFFHVQLDLVLMGEALFDSRCETSFFDLNYLVKRKGSILLLF